MADGTKDVRAYVQRHTYCDVPMWRVQVFDGDARLSTDFVLDWDTAIRLGNHSVARARVSKLKAKRARYSRVGKMRNHRRKALINSMRSDGTFERTFMVSVLQAFAVLPEEIGLRLEFAEEGAAA